MLRRFFVGASLVTLLSGGVAEAYTVTQPTFALQYDVITLDGDPEQQRTLLGELDNAPEMYEITSDHDFTLTVEIRAVPGSETVPEFTGIIIRQKEVLGVEEVARMLSAEASWAPIIDGVTGLVYQSGPFYSEKVPAGTYRIEVSTPVNTGKYMLVVGTVPSETSYLETLAAVGLVYDFYDLSHVRMFRSPYVHYPVGIIVLLLLIGGTWYWQRRSRSHA